MTVQETKKDIRWSKVKMKKYIDNLIQYKFLLSELVKKGIKLKYRRSYLGIVWSLLEPLLTMIVLTIVFGTLYGNTDKTFPVYILTGRLIYSYYSTATKSALKSIRANSAMIKKVYVPKYLYPLSTVIFNYIIFLISLIVLAAVSIVQAYYLSASGTYRTDSGSDPFLWMRHDPCYHWRILQGYGVFMVCFADDHHVYLCHFLLS